MQQMNQLVTSMSATLTEMEWDRRKCKSSLGDCIYQFEQLKIGSSLWMCQLDLLKQAISYDPDMVIALAFYSNISKLAQRDTHSQQTERNRESNEHLHIPAGFHINHHHSAIFNVFLKKILFWYTFVCVSSVLCSLQISYSLFFSCLTVNRSKWGGAMMKETCMWTSFSRWSRSKNDRSWW